MKKQTFWTIIIILAVIGVVAGYSKTNSKPSINIGADVPLTGTLAFIGQSENNGLKMAVEDINASGGIDGFKIKLISEDNQGQPNTAVSVAQKLINTDRAHLIYTSFTNITQAIQETVLKSNTPMIYSASHAQTALSSDLFFRDYFDILEMARTVSNYLSKKEYKRAAYMGEINVACDEYINTVKLSLEKNGTKFLTEYKYSPEEKDLRTGLSKIKTYDPEVIVTCTHKRSDMLLTQMKQLDMINIPAIQLAAPFLPNGDTAEIRKLYEENHSISTWYGFVYGSLNDKQEKFKQRYEAKYNLKLSSDAAFAYDDVVSAADAMKGCVKEMNNHVSLDNKCFIDNLQRTNLDGVAGKLSFDKDGLSQRETVLMQVVNGEWVSI